MIKQITILLAGLLLFLQTVIAQTVTIQNTSPRKDNNGNIIDCHDGCLEFFEGKYYLYGTRYGDTDGFTQANRYVCYSSTDLLEWTFHDDLLKNPPEGVYYRPYVKYNPKTKKYVLWYNWYPVLWEGQYGVAVSDSPAGSYIIHDRDVKVKQPRPGDHGLFVDNDGTAYLIYTSIEKKHGISIERLTDDYLCSTFENSGIFAEDCEAASMFKKDKIYYALFDSCCCFCPQGSGARVYASSHPLGPYTLQGNINRDKNVAVIIPAQQTHIAILPAAEGYQYIWMGDMWGSRADGVKGHDLQYWSGPLQFDDNGIIRKLAREDTVQIKLSQK